MSRLIDADALKKAMYPLVIYRSIEAYIDDAPTIEERKKGRIVNPTPYGECSECGCLIDSREGYNFCPNCGADMREQK